jgi:acylphosphatase
VPDSTSAERREVHYTGQVQGVGFRYTTQHIAQRMAAVTGYVQNLPDGRVRLLVEGPPNELDALLKAIRTSMTGCIERTHVDRSPATGEFADFRVRY